MEFDLKESTFDVAASTVLILIWYFSLKGTTDGSEKRLSWILTLLSAIVSTFGCIPLVYEGFSLGWPATIIYGNGRLSRLLVKFFVTYLCWDSFFIYRDYPTIGGMFHHVPYLVFMALSLYYHCPSMFVVFMPMEVSSIFLSLGHIWPNFRADIPFGITFFAGRVLYHAYLWLQLYNTRSESPFLVYPFSILPLFVHIHWFGKWCFSMLKKRKGKGENLKEKEEKTKKVE